MRSKWCLTDLELSHHLMLNRLHIIIHWFTPSYGAGHWSHSQCGTVMMVLMVSVHDPGREHQYFLIVVLTPEITIGRLVDSRVIRKKSILYIYFYYGSGQKLLIGTP